MARDRQRGHQAPGLRRGQRGLGAADEAMAEIQRPILRSADFRPPSGRITRTVSAWPSSRVGERMPLRSKAFGSWTSPACWPGRIAPRRCSTWAPRSSSSSRRGGTCPGGAAVGAVSRLLRPAECRQAQPQCRPERSRGPPGAAALRYRRRHRRELQAGRAGLVWIGLETISGRNPGVVYASISGYGQNGSWRNRMAYAPTVQAETGITMNTPDTSADERPRTDSLSHADVYSGLHAAIAILAASTTARTGEGQYIDIAMAAVILSINERVHADLSDAELGDEPPVLGATDARFSPTGRCAVRDPMSLVGSTFPFYLRRCAGRIWPGPAFRTPELRNGTWRPCTGSSRSGSGPSRTWRRWTPNSTRRRSPRARAQRQGFRGQRLGPRVERGPGRVRRPAARSRSGPAVALRGPGGGRQDQPAARQGEQQRRGPQRAGFQRRRDRGAGRLRYYPAPPLKYRKRFIES